MNRIQRKCLIATTACHGLLLLILLIGPAFLSSNSGQITPPLNFVPAKLVDAAVQGGGNPNGRPPTPTPPTPAPPQVATPSPPPARPQPRQVTAPDPEPPKVTRPTHDGVETNRAHHIDIDPHMIVHSSAKKAGAASSTPSSPDNSDQIRRIGSEFKTAASSLRGGLSGGTEIEPIGPGGGGATYASYDAYIRTIYMQAWIEPDGVEGNISIPKATVTIARDGKVISASLTHYSGNQAVDAAVLETLNRVQYIAPFPEGAREEQRTYTIKFDLQAKKNL